LQSIVDEDGRIGPLCKMSLALDRITRRLRRHLSKRMVAKHERLSHNQALGRLAAVGFSPGVIYDIGAYRGGWSKSVSRVFPSADFVLFDANLDNEPFLAETGYRYFMRALSDTDSTNRELFTPMTGDTTGTSLYVENTSHYDSSNLVVRSVPVWRLDTVVEKHVLPSPDLIKIDAQGAEIDIINGAPRTLASANALILEAAFLPYNKGGPLISQLIGATDRCGLRCADICEIHRSSEGIALQVDLLFVRDGLLRALSASAGLK